MKFGAAQWLQLGALVIFVSIAGAISSAWGTAIAIAVTLWFLLQLRDTIRFRRWITRPLRRPDLADATWQPVAERVFRTYRANRRRTHTALNRLRQFRLATEALPDGAILIKPGGEIEMYNSAAQSLLGLTRGDIGSNLVSLVRNPSLTAMVDGMLLDRLIEIAAPHTQTQLEIRRIDVDDNQILILARDVTQLNRLLSMRQDFVANVSHELRTPLTVIRGYLESLEDPDLTPPQITDIVKRLHAPAQRMRVLVDDLLLLTRLESSPNPQDGEVSEILVATLLESLANDARQLSDSRHQINVRADARLTTRGVEAELHSAFGNLIGNAIRYSPNGGTVTITWQRAPEGARFEVTDEGIGISAEHIHRITERFYRVDLAGSRMSGGTGLGLAIVKHVLKRHHATLGIESRPGQGSRFYCVFPESSALDSQA